MACQGALIATRINARLQTARLQIFHGPGGSSPSTGRGGRSKVGSKASSAHTAGGGGGGGAATASAASSGGPAAMAPLLAAVQQAAVAEHMVEL